MTAALSATVPPAIPGVVFLSGGQSSRDSVKHLDVINKTMNKHRTHHASQGYNAFPWKVSFSFGRALQADALELWGKAWKEREVGKDEKKGKDEMAGKAFNHWAEKSHDAARGELHA